MQTNRLIMRKAPVATCHFSYRDVPIKPSILSAWPLCLIFCRCWPCRQIGRFYRQNFLREMRHFATTNEPIRASFLVYGLDFWWVGGLSRVSCRGGVFRPWSCLYGDRRYWNGMALSVVFVFFIPLQSSRDYSSFVPFLWVWDAIVLWYSGYMVDSRHPWSSLVVPLSSAKRIPSAR